MVTYTFANRGTYFNRIEDASLALADCMKTMNEASVELTSDAAAKGVRIRIENGAGWCVSYVQTHNSFIRFLVVE